MAVPVVAILALIAVTLYAFHVVFWATQYQAVQNSGLLKNNPNVAQSEFIRLLDKAAKEMIIYDDGDLVADSIYDSEEVVQAVHDKLGDHPDFVIRCLFNWDTRQLRFCEEFGSKNPQVQIRTRSGPEGPYSGPVPRLPHFKIIDGGSCAYLSWHDPGSESRFYQTIDFSGVSRIGRDRVVGKIVGKYIDRFDRTFSSARTFEQLDASQLS